MLSARDGGGAGLGDAAQAERRSQKCCKKNKAEESGACDDGRSRRQGQKKWAKRKITWVAAKIDSENKGASPCNTHQYAYH
ncbi:MAG: hypothetical protein WDN02_06115 [Methylovirgula sp.]|uniref:hypothetical protein n=1 Tax=Methylovirgula sp. TaxID=1978224 RepID=UPI003075FC7D